MRKWSVKILALLCAVTLMAALVPLTVLPTSAGKILKHRSETTLLEEIIQRDGFVEGIWYPWFTHTYLGCGLTSNELAAQWLNGWSNATNCWYDFSKVGIDEYGADKIYQEIYNLKSMGYNLLGYEGSIYGEGVIYDDTGDVIGIKDEYLYNVRRFLDMCRDIGMPVLWTVTCHSSSVPQYYTNGKTFWDKACRYYADKTVADHYAERFVKPLAKVLAEYPDVVAMVASTSEAENEINDSQVGNYFEGNRAFYGVDQEHMVYFINAVTEAVKAAFPAVPRTICCQLEDMSLYSEIDFDILGDQNYNYLGRADAIEDFRPTVPMFASEFGMGDEYSNISDADLTEVQLAFRKNYRKEGYQGCVMWCWSPDSKSGSAYDLLKKNPTGVTDFRTTAYDLYYYIQEQRDAHRGETTLLDTPQVFCNTGNGKLEWVSPRQATRIDILYSDDGGKTWVKEVDNDKISRYLTGHKGVYIFDNDPTENTVYKIVVRDDKGNEKSSQVSNKASDMTKFNRKYTGSKEDNKTFNLGNYPFNLKNVAAVMPMRLTNHAVGTNRPATASANLLADGSFETSLGGFASAAVLKATADKTAPDGSRSLYFDTSATTEAGWHILWVTVEKNTDYTFSTWIKGAPLSSSNRGYATIGVVNSDNKRFLTDDGTLPFYTQTQQIVPTAWDNSWHLRAVSFNSGSHTKVGIALYGCSSKMYVDGMALYKSDQGVIYRSDNMSQSISIRMDVEKNYCTDANNVFQNATMDKSSYWSGGDGWKGGFLSIADNRYEYGKSLKYTASAKSVGQYYLKWVDVEPNTWYTFSVDMKVLKSGEGRLVLLDGKLRNPGEIISLPFDTATFGEGWFATAFRLNTGCHTRIAIGVVDGGGSALIDNLRLFKTANGIAGDDTYRDPQTGNTVAPPTATARPSVGDNTDATQPDGETTTTVTESTVTDSTATTVPSGEGDTAPTDAVEDTEDAEVKPADPKPFPWLIVGVSGGVMLLLLLIAAGVVIFLVLRKKKANNP